MTAPVEEIIKHYDDEEVPAIRVNFRKFPGPSIALSEHDPIWFERFEEVRKRIQTALGEKALSIVHTGSTSVSGLPAKAIIDVDLTVSDILDEDSYAPALENEGFTLLFRQPRWHQHRFFAYDTPDGFPVNLHVWGPNCPEVERHRIFREWIIKTPEDRDLYVKVKRESSEAAQRAGETADGYNLRKQSTIREILGRAFRDRGYIS